MPRYASGKFAKGTCMRSGKVVPYNDLVRDGHIHNLMVAPDWYEPEHPLETIEPVSDPVALRHPSPRRGHLNVTVRFPLFDVDTGGYGSDLFLLSAETFDLVSNGFNVALYVDKPGTTYSTANETAGSGYVPGGLPVALSVDNGEVALDTTSWASATFGALWLLVYEVISGDALMRMNLGSLHVADNGVFTINWSSARYYTDGDRITNVVA